MGSGIRRERRPSGVKERERIDGRAPARSSASRRGSSARGGAHVVRRGCNALVGSRVRGRRRAAGQGADAGGWME
jgi:hypothetical protein